MATSTTPITEITDGDMFWACGSKCKRMAAYDERGMLAGYSLADGHLLWMRADAHVTRANASTYDPPVPRPRNWGV